jgi:hypothetical protein
MLVLTGSLLVVGCSSEKDPFEDWYSPWKYDSFVPLTAKTVASGTDTMTFTAPEQGVLYVVDMDQMVQVEQTQKPKVIGQALIQSGAEITFDPQQKRAYAKGKEGVKLSKVVPGHHFELRFDPSNKPKT